MNETILNVYIIPIQINTHIKLYTYIHPYIYIYIYG